MKDQYVITGILKNGKRFKPIQTSTPQHYNIWKGTIWKLYQYAIAHTGKKEGRIVWKRKLIKRI